MRAGLQLNGVAWAGGQAVQVTLEGIPWRVYPVLVILSLYGAGKSVELSTCSTSIPASASYTAAAFPTTQFGA